MLAEGDWKPSEKDIKQRRTRLHVAKTPDSDKRVLAYEILELTPDKPALVQTGEFTYAGEFVNSKREHR